ncbi:hypothetical protein B0T16DRAFT_345606 [Cercophora newfieldiana]|uniref:Uncharacterized protein n=1 Tax=Cercophora newfieldiana TaxID=92897 RepID=A0AA39YFQ5_9PEZI|nr:hypothetical protein B0T16DRAFT_345606 [Cercophora newfieldiana]
MASPLWHALIRTHRITSRRKVAHLRKAADWFECWALLRSGGCPGIMYCKGSEDGVKEWVECGLRYKDFRLVAKPSLIDSPPSSTDPPGLTELAAVSDFAEAMAERGNLLWFERAMGFS